MEEMLLSAPHCPSTRYPNPNVKDVGLSKRNKALLRQWQVRVRKENLVLSEKNDARVCGAHFPGLCRASVTDVPSVFAWSKQTNQRRTLLKHPLPSARLNTKDLDREAASAAVDDEDRGDPADPADPDDPVDPVVSVDVPSRGDSACADGVELDSAVVSAADLVDSADNASANDFLDNSYPEENIWQEYRRCQAENDALRDELVFLKAKLAEAVDRQEELEERLEKSRFTMKNFQHSDNLVRFYTGLPNADYFQAYFQLASSCLVKLPAGRPHCLSDEDEFFIMLVKLRRNFPEEELAVRTGVSQSTVSRAFRKWVTALATALRSLPIWPSREQVNLSMPANVQSMYPNARVIIDGVEIFIEKSANPTAQSTTWSSYKHHNTAKALVGVTPSGSVSFVSKLYGGRISDKRITRLCGILTLLDEGDVVLADKGFDITEEVAAVKATLNIPAFLRDKQFSHGDLLQTRRVASVRIHVERAIEQMKNYNILSCLPISFMDVADEIWSCCSLLTLCLPPLNQD